MLSQGGHSIRRTVLLWQLAALLLLGIVSMVAAYSLAARSFSELRDIELSQIADAVARHGIDDDDTTTEQPGDFLSQLWEADGRLGYASHDPPLPLPEKLGTQDFFYDGHLWHGLASRYDGQTILVAREAGERRRLLVQLSLPMLAGLLALTLVLMLTLALRMRQALQPLERLRAALAARPPSALEPLQIDAAPVELQSLITTLNELFARVHGVIEGQRRFTADAAHQLRTPITAIALCAQLAEQQGDSQVPDQNIRSIRSSCQRAAEMIEQLLILARLDEEPLSRPEKFSLDHLLRTVIADLSLLADAGQVDLGLTEAPPLNVTSDAGEWRLLLDNLVGNAVRYTPAGGRVDVALLPQSDGSLLIHVDDSGPGIPDAELAQVFERFHRLAGSDKPGNGLGLAIVQRVAVRLGLTIRLSNRPSGGLRAELRVPPVAESQSR